MTSAGASVADRRDLRIAELEGLVAELRDTIEVLVARVAELEARLGENSSNSGKPPSSDPPSARNERSKPKSSGRARGGQPGHKGHQRELLGAEAVTSTVDHFPETCEACARKLPRRPCVDPVRSQILELPEVRPEVTEHRQHCVECACGHVTRAKLPSDLPPGMCGPRLTAVIGLVTGVYHLSRRTAVGLLGDLLGVRIALGSVSNAEERVSAALSGPVDEAVEAACDAPLKHVDATGWRQAGQSRTLWTIATALVTVFAVTLDGSRDHLREVLTKVRGILVSDRAPQFLFWAMQRRQICWAHLLRKFVAFSQDSRPEVARLGSRLLRFEQDLFRQWHRVRDGTLTRAAFRRDTRALRMCVEGLLQQGVELRLPRVSGSCADILVHRQALWTFIDRTDVEPTNNHGERELRAFVLWRKKCFGSQSDRGDRFAERVMTAVHTLRKQRRNVLEFLTEAVAASFQHLPPPSLLHETP